MISLLNFIQFLKFTVMTDENSFSVASVSTKVRTYYAGSNQTFS